MIDTQGKIDISNITGDLFIDTGNLVMEVLKDHLNTDEKGVVEYMLDRYLSDWNKAVYTFFPNSAFIQPSMTLEQKIKFLRKVYIDGDFDSTYRSMIILGHSSSFVNFAPNHQVPKASKEAIIAHLLAPFGSMRFYYGKQKSKERAGMYSFIFTSNIPVWKERVTRIILRNLKHAGPYQSTVITRFKYAYSIYKMLSPIEADNTALTFTDVTNYNQGPLCYIDTYFHRDITAFRAKKFLNENFESLTKAQYITLLGYLKQIPACEDINEAFVRFQSIISELTISSPFTIQEFTNDDEG